MHMVDQDTPSKQYASPSTISTRAHGNLHAGVPAVPLLHQRLSLSIVRLAKKQLLRPLMADKAELSADTLRTMWLKEMLVSRCWQLIEPAAKLQHVVAHANPSICLTAEL